MISILPGARSLVFVRLYPSGPVILPGRCAFLRQPHFLRWYNPSDQVFSRVVHIN